MCKKCVEVTFILIAIFFSDNSMTVPLSYIQVVAKLRHFSPVFLFLLYQGMRTDYRERPDWVVTLLPAHPQVYSLFFKVLVHLFIPMLPDPRPLKMLFDVFVLIIKLQYRGNRREFQFWGNAARNCSCGPRNAHQIHILPDTLRKVPQTKSGE